jgi:hypothetical protein
MTFNHISDVDGGELANIENEVGVTTYSKHIPSEQGHNSDIEPPNISWIYRIHSEYTTFFADIRCC